jgi:putative transcriptional regulator
MTKNNKPSARENESPLKKLREAAGLSQQELASRIGVGVTTISRWERGASPAMMTIPQIRSLCRELGVTFDELPDEFGPSK